MQHEGVFVVVEAMSYNANGLVCHAHVHGFLVRLAVHSHRLDAELLRSAENATGDLTAIRHHQLIEILLSGCMSRLQYRGLQKRMRKECHSMDICVQQ
jgi:hypothetical protein